METTTLINKIQKHLSKKDGDWWRILNLYTDNSALIEWGKNGKVFTKNIK